MKNSNENLIEGTWLLTFLQHKNALFYYQKFQNVNFATFTFILTCHKKPGRNPDLDIYDIHPSHLNKVPRYIHPSHLNKVPRYIHPSL